jgi:membrane-associated protease RseP (regulator of RpoE activity)
MLILSAHEFGHYLASRRVSVESTLPFFIPAPPPVGTFGAIIKMRSTVTNRKALMAIGAAGPVAGFLVALPVVILGLHLSTYGVSQPQDSGFALGPSLLFSLLTRAVMGVSPADYDVYLHPVAFAGWWGFFITALNLLPIGQTDGGHVIYSVFGKHHRWVSQAVFFILLPMGFFLWPGWLMWAVVMLVLRLRHPPLLDESTELETKYKLLGVLVLLIFVLTFVPTPFQITF